MTCVERSAERQRRGDRRRSGHSRAVRATPCPRSEPMPDANTMSLRLGCLWISTRLEGLMSKRTVNVVLVHGGFVDGAGWEGVYSLLRRDGYSVSIVQNPTISLADDVGATRLILAA